MQQNVPSLNELLDFGHCHGRYRDAVVVTKIDHCIAMRICGDQ
jgi:hypothetical protein